MSDCVEILVVEDDEFTVERTYKEWLTDKRYSLDFAFSEAEAKEKVLCKSYDVAFVDIMLRDDRYDRGGVELIRHLVDLRESTSIIVMSATDDIDVALNTFNAGIEKFIRKRDVHGPKDLLGPLEAIVENLKFKSLSHFGLCSSLQAYLANSELMPIWESKWIAHLGTSYEIFSAALNNALENKLGILKLIDTSDCFVPGESERSAYGVFWSKKLGYGILVTMAFPDSTLPKPTDTFVVGESLYHRKYRN